LVSISFERGIGNGIILFFNANYWNNNGCAGLHEERIKYFKNYSDCYWFNIDNIINIPFKVMPGTVFD